MLKAQKLRSFWNSENGATAIEYALIAAIVSVAIVAGLQAIRSSLQNIFGNIATQFAAILN